MEVSSFKFQVSNSKFQVSNSKFGLLGGWEVVPGWAFVVGNDGQGTFCFRWAQIRGRRVHNLIQILKQVQDDDELKRVHTFAGNPDEMFPSGISQGKSLRQAAPATSSRSEFGTGS